MRSYIRIVRRIHHVLVVFLSLLIADRLAVLSQLRVLVHIIDHHLSAILVDSVHHHVLLHHLSILLNNFNVGGVHLHVGRPIVQYCGRNVGHRVSKLAQLVVAVREAAVDAKFTMAVCLEILAELSFVIAVEHSDVLLAWETLRKWLLQDTRLMIDTKATQRCYLRH